MCKKAYFVATSIVLDAFLVGNSFTLLHNAHRNRARDIIRTNYFDDVSRCSLEWHPLPADDELRKRLEAKAAADKMQLMKRVLGHDAKSASALEKKEVRRLVRQWSKQSGAVGRIQGDELYDELVGIKVCGYEDTMGCLAYFWHNIVKIIHDGEAERRDNSVLLVTFPYCKELYSYETHSILNSAVDLGRELCMHLGSDLTLTMFHPKYKNAPSLFSPERHSPFPASGLQFTPKGMGKNEINTPVDDSYIPGLDAQRVNLERLFNSAAATSADIAKDRTTEQETIRLTRRWFDDNRDFMCPSGRRLANEAVRHVESVAEDAWYVSKATIAEEAYADMWALIFDLHRRGSKQKEAGKGVLSSVVIIPDFSNFNAPQWRKFAVSVNAVLKKLVGDKMFLEVFHPEYTGSASSSSTTDELRRSPFPTIQICYKQS